MTKKKDKEVVEEVVDKDDDTDKVVDEAIEKAAKDLPGAEFQTGSWEDVIKPGQETVEASTDIAPEVKANELIDAFIRPEDSEDSVDIFTDPATALKVILATLKRLEEKFDKTFNNHTLNHGRFRRGRKAINR